MLTTEPTWRLHNFSLDSSIKSVTGLTAQDEKIFLKLIDLFRYLSTRNSNKKKYYDGENLLKDFGISIPPKLTITETVVGWPAKAVDMLAARSLFDGFVFRDNEQHDELIDIFEQNQFKSMNE